MGHLSTSVVVIDSCDASQKNPGKNSNKPFQLKLSNFASKSSSCANCEDSKANVSISEAMAETKNNESTDRRAT